MMKPIAIPFLISELNSGKMKRRVFFRAHWLFLWLIFLNFAATSAHGQERKRSIFQHLTSTEMPKILLETDLTTFIANKKTSQYFPAILSTSDGKSYKMEIKSRGRYRRKVAEIPPMKMKFKKKDLLAEGFDTLNEIKLVLPCYDTELGDELIVKEYLAYKMFEHVTAASVRAHLIKLTIRDTHVEKSKKTMLAILLEDEEETAARMNGSIVEEYGVPTDSLILNQAALVVMFEYMIGNTDWEIAMQRNVRLIRSPSTGKILVIPYDFDFSGLVSAPYSSPSSDSGLKTVRDRFLMSSGLKPEPLKRAMNVLRSSKEEFLELCKSKHLSRHTSDEMTYFLETFFNQIEGKEEIPALIKMPQGD
jgi:hypothetical protein